jgi:hypothetical protein
MQHGQIDIGATIVAWCELRDDGSDRRKSVGEIAGKSQAHHSAIADAEQVLATAVRLEFRLYRVKHLLDESDIVVTGSPGTAIALAAFHRASVSIGVGDAVWSFVLRAEIGREIIPRCYPV